MQENAFEGADKFLRTAVFGSHPIVDARVVHERIDVIECRNRLLDNCFAVLRRGKINGNESGLEPLSPKLIM